MTEETKPAEQSAEATPDTATKAVTAAATPPGRFETVFRRWFDARTVLYLTGGVIALLVVLVAGTYLWNVFTVRGLQQRMATEREQLSAEQRKAMDLQARELLRLAARPLAWAIRAELLRGNLGQVDDYMREFVRERGVNSILLVGPDGKILLATNRKLETQLAEGLVSKPLLAAAEPTFEEAAGMIRLAVPVAGFDRRLGLLVLDYDPAAK
jgi:hypothetical protein